jgi:hypothetical protein
LRIISAILALPAGVCVQCFFFGPAEAAFVEPAALPRRRQLRRMDLANLAFPSGV